MIVPVPVSLTTAEPGLFNFAVNVNCSLLSKIESFTVSVLP